MLSEQLWLRPSDGLKIELEQCQDEGKDLSGLQDEAEAILVLPRGAERESRAAAFYEKTILTPSSLDAEEPAELEKIRERMPGGDYPVPALSSGELRDRIHGAWLGRSCGCLLGKPVECWYRERIAGFLRETDNLPPRGFLRSDVSPDILGRYGVTPEAAASSAFINNTDCMPEDDDTNYTLIGLRVLERYGFGFTSADVGECWLSELPLLHLCTAERVAYINLSRLILPPLSAAAANPYREWIGAQIRADFYGYVSAGDLDLAAELAYRDAVVSHTKNGVYGAMLVAAMISAAYSFRDAASIVRAGLSRIPAECRLAKAVREVLRWYGENVSYEEAVDRVHGRYDEKSQHQWCHVIPNAMIVCAALLYGGLDLESTISKAVLPGFDTDCNGATAGSIVGMALGAGRLPEAWTAPIGRGIRSGLAGRGLESFDSLVERTLRLI